jgi:hypothetical protein
LVLNAAATTTTPERARPRARPAARPYLIPHAVTQSPVIIQAKSKLQVRRKGGAELPPPTPSPSRLSSRPASGGGPGGGGGGGWGTPGSLPDLAPLDPGPICEKSRFQDAKREADFAPHPTKPSQAVGEPGAACGVSELPGHGCCSLRWPADCRLVASSFGGLRKDQVWPMKTRRA